MAIKWRQTITVLDAKKKNVSITLERIDDTDPENIKVLNRCSILDALINTIKLKQQVITELKRQYQEQKAKITVDAAIIGTLKDDISVAIVAWETK